MAKLFKVKEEKAVVLQKLAASRDDWYVKNGTLMSVGNKFSWSSWLLVTVVVSLIALGVSRKEVFADSSLGAIIVLVAVGVVSLSSFIVCRDEPVSVRIVSRPSEEYRTWVTVRREDFRLDEIESTKLALGVDGGLDEISDE